jgi:hypothetical protein
VAIAALAEAVGTAASGCVLVAAVRLLMAEPAGAPATDLVMAPVTGEADPKSDRTFRIGTPALVENERCVVGHEVPATHNTANSPDDPTPT